MTDSDLQIRLASPADAADLARLRFDFRSETRANVEEATAFIDRFSQWLAPRMRKTTWRCWVIERDKTLIGHLWLQLIEKIPNPTLEPEFHAYITNFFIVEAERGQALGSRLLSSALSWCREAGVQNVVLWPSEKSRSLYE